MSVLDDLGLSEGEFEHLDETIQAKLIEGGAKLSAEKQMIGNEILEQDDRDIRDRANAVRKSLLRQDANNCEDEPYTEPEVDVQNMRALGDIYIGDKAWRSANKQSVDSSVDNSVKKWTPIVLGSLLTIGGGLLAWKWLDRDPDPSSPVAIYSIEALPFESPQPLP